ncbi:reverse transcriptase domain-containing protein [Tanacetum coccineum]
MWAADRVVALTPGSVITIIETANEFAIKGNHLTLVKGNQFDGIIKTDPNKHIHEFLGICDMFKYRDTENEVVRLMMFPLSLTGEAKIWLDELNKGTIEMWDELRTAFISRFFPPALFDRLLEEIRAFSQHENETLTEAWLCMKEMLRYCHGHNLSKGNIIKIFYHGLNEITQEVLNAAAGGIFLYKTPKQAYQLLEDKVLLKLDWAKNQKSKPSLKKQLLLQMKQSGRPSGYLPSNTQPNPKGSSSKPYQPPQARNEQVNAVFKQSGKSYDPPINPNDQQNDSETPIKFDSDDEDKEPTPQPKPKDLKPVKEDPTTKPYKPKIPYPQCLRKEKTEARHEKFLDMIRAVRINVPLVDVLVGMPNYGKFLKELKLPPKLGDPGSFLIPCNFNKAFSCDALADLGASINLMPYSLYVKLSLKTLKPTKMSISLFSKWKKTVNIDVIDEILEEDFDALLDEENSESESDTEEPSFKKITFNTDYKIKTSLEEPPTDLELKPLPDNLEYAFSEEPSSLPVIISSQLPKKDKIKLIFVLKRHKQAFA